MSGAVERDWLRILPSYWQVGEAVLSSVAVRHGLDVAALKSERRDRPVSWARQEAMLILRDEQNWTYSKIGRLLGGLDHTTVRYGVEQARNRLAMDWNRT